MRTNHEQAALVHDWFYFFIIKINLLLKRRWCLWLCRYRCSFL